MSDNSAKNDEKKINPFLIPISLAKTNIEKVLVNVLNTVSDDMYIKKVYQMQKDIDIHKEEAAKDLSNEIKERVKSEDEMLELIIELCDEDISIADENNELSNKQRIKCKAIAKMILNGTYGVWNDDAELQRILNEVKGEYNLTNEMVEYVKAIVSSGNGGNNNGSN